MRLHYAEVINPRFRALADDDISSKTHPGDLVTVADQEAEVIITRALRAAYPQALVLGEEAYAVHPHLLEDYRTAEHVWTVVEGDTLALIAYREYGDPTLWRRIADANRMSRVRRLTPGAALLVPHDV